MRFERMKSKYCLSFLGDEVKREEDEEE